MQTGDVAVKSGGCVAETAAASRQTGGSDGERCTVAHVNIGGSISRESCGERGARERFIGLISS